MSEPAVEASELSKWYGSVIALNNVDLTVERGVIALLGPNGAGKTTLIKLLTGQLRPSSGSARIFGQPVVGNPDVYLEVGVCPEFDSFWEDMNAVEFLTILAKLTGFTGPAARRRAEDLLDLVALDGARRRRIRTYSKGMRQRVKLAQALLSDPRVIFLDEPMTGLDPVARRSVADVIREFEALGKTVVISSHVLHEVESLTDNFVLLVRGQVVAEGDVHAIRQSLEDRPYAIRVVCDDARRVAERLVDRDYVTGLTFERSGKHETLVVTTRRANDAFSELPAILIELGVHVHEISSPDDNIEAVFDYLVRT